MLMFWITVINFNLRPRFIRKKSNIFMASLILEETRIREVRGNFRSHVRRASSVIGKQLQMHVLSLNGVVMYLLSREVCTLTNSEQRLSSRRPTHH